MVGKIEVTGTLGDGNVAGSVFTMAVGLNEFENSLGGIPVPSPLDL